MNDIPTPSSHPCQENSSFSAFVEKVETWGLDEFRASPRRAPSATRKTHQVIEFRGARYGHFGGLKRWWGGADQEIQSAFLAKLRRLWELHDEGRSSREIARELGWKSHASVLHHLKRPRPAANPPCEWSIATEGTPMKALLKKEDCTLFEQRGREKEFAVMQKAERAIAKANPANPGGKGTANKSSVAPDDATLPASTLRNIRQAHRGLSDVRFSESPEFLAALKANEQRNAGAIALWRSAPTSLPQRSKGRGFAGVGEQMRHVAHFKGRMTA